MFPLVGIDMKALRQKVKLRRTLPRSLRSRALHRTKVLLDLKCKRVKLLADEAFGKKRSSRPEQVGGRGQRSSIQLQAACDVGVADPT